MKAFWLGNQKFEKEGRFLIQNPTAPNNNNTYSKLC